MPTRLIGATRQAMLHELRGWHEVVDRDAIRKSFHFVDFPEAFAFMTRVALASEKIGHHPEWSNAVDRVEIVLTTYDVGGLSDLDIKLAQAIDSLAPLRDRAP